MLRYNSFIGVTFVCFHAVVPVSDMKTKCKPLKTVICIVRTSGLWYEKLLELHIKYGNGFSVMGE